MALVTATVAITTSAPLEAEYLSAGHVLLYPLKDGGYPTIVARTDGGALPATYDGLPQTYLETYTDLYESYPRIKYSDTSVMLFRVHSTCDAGGGWTINEVAIYATDGTRLGIATAQAIAANNGDQIKLDVEVDVVTPVVTRYAAIVTGTFTPQYAQWLAYRNYINPSVTQETRNFTDLYIAVGTGTTAHKSTDRKLEHEIDRQLVLFTDQYTEFCTADTYVLVANFFNATAANIDVYEVGLFDAQGLLLWRYCAGTKIGTLTVSDTKAVPIAWTIVEGKSTDKEKNLLPRY
jgi:hypothetical protein